EPVVDAEEVRHVADQLSNPVGIVRHLDAADGGRSRVRQDQGRQDPNRGRLPRSVGPHEAEYLTARDVQLKASKRRVAAVLLPKGFDRDHWPLRVSWESKGALSWIRVRTIPPAVS